MKTFHLRKGADIPISGQPQQVIEAAAASTSVAALGADYVGLKPRVQVDPGQTVERGEALFFHKDMPDVLITTPLGGTVKAINRGARRVLQSIEIEVDDAADSGLKFDHGTGREGLIEMLCQSGLWTAFRTRPYSKLADPGVEPDAIFVTATDSEPLCADPALIIEAAADAFVAGLEAVAALTDGSTYLCQDHAAQLPGNDVAGVEVAGFGGPHPAGLAGTHIHFLHPLRAESRVWTIGYQDVIAIGRLMQTGYLDPERIIALSGPACKRPRLLRTVMGASLADIAAHEAIDDSAIRMISGSVLSGHLAADVTAYLGRYSRQVTLMQEDHEQHLLGWVRPMAKKFALQPVLASSLFKRLFPLTTNLNGGRRAMVPYGTFERLMPQDYLPTQLLRSLLIMDTDTAQQLGALELDEEDLGLVGFACPAKYEYGVALRDCLTKIEQEG